MFPVTFLSCVYLFIKYLIRPNIALDARKAVAKTTRMALVSDDASGTRNSVWWTLHQRSHRAYDLLPSVRTQSDYTSPKKTYRWRKDAHDHLLLETCNQNYNKVSHHTSQMAIIKKSTNNKYWRGCGERGTLLHYWWECKLVQPLWRIVWRFLKKLKIELPYDPANPLLGIFWRKP